MIRVSKLAAAALIGAAFATSAADAAQFSVLYSFRGGHDGAEPEATLIRDADGNLYGTTARGGVKSCDNGLGCGTVFRIAPDGSETVLHHFKGGRDGAVPAGRLVIDAHGTLFGTTREGGLGTNCAGGNGCGAVFRIRSDGTKQVVYAFQGGTDGAVPLAGLTLDQHGNLYGTTSSGGGGNCGPCGTVFRISRDGSETVLHVFLGFADGYDPEAGLIFDDVGILYGTTRFGGGNGCNGTGCGTVFKITPEGMEHVVYSFKGGGFGDGQQPTGDLVRDSAGNFYGTTFEGGSTFFGTVFKLTPLGQETVLDSFTGSANGDDAYPASGVVLDGTGNLYGTTWLGGSNAHGTVFKLTPDGTESRLYTFKGRKDGGAPLAGLVTDASGNLYGAAADGGRQKCDRGCGIVYVLTNP